jgi:predicted N-formylglutamate amidohydrolase
MDAARLARHASSGSAKVTNREGRSPLVIVCDHASNFIPAEYATLGLDASELKRHIAWDPGALPVAERMAAALDAVLVQSCLSRLVVDCNRPLDAPDLIPAVSETTEIPGNRNLGADERAVRIALAHAPFHQAIDEIIAERLKAGRATRLVSVHSFTPVYKGVRRPWHIGIIHDDDRRLAAPLIEALETMNVTVGINQPYSPADRVYYTLERHARSRGLPCAMIEIRNDEIENIGQQKEWAGRLAGIFAAMRVGPTRAETTELDGLAL